MTSPFNLKALRRTLPLLLLMFALRPDSTWAQATPTPPGQISYQGFLVDANGIPLATNTPRNYDLILRIYNVSSGGSPLWAEVQTVTVDDKHVGGLVLALKSLGELSGTLRVEGKDPVSPKGLQVALDGTDTPGKGGEATAGDDGKFIAKNLLPDRYRVSISNAPAGVYLKSVRYGDQDVTDDGADLTGSIAGSLDVVLAADGAEVSGAVADADGNAMSGITVVLIPKSRRERLYRTDTTDQSGAFRFQSVPPGDYKLMAWEDVAPGAWFDPDFLKPFEGKAEAVSVAAKESKSVTLKAIPMETKR